VCVCVVVVHQRQQPGRHVGELQQWGAEVKERVLEHAGGCVDGGGFGGS
jgi:hypothetical protein